MIVTIANTKYKIPTSFKDVTYSHLLKFIEATLKDNADWYDMLSAKTGLSRELIDNLSLSDQKNLDELTEFFYNFDTLSAYPVDTRIAESIDIGMASADKILQCEQQLKIAKNKIPEYDVDKHSIIQFLFAGAEILKIYLSHEKRAWYGVKKKIVFDINERPCVEVVGLVLFFCQRLHNFLKFGRNISLVNHHRRNLSPQELKN